MEPAPSEAVSSAPEASLATCTRCGVDLDTQGACSWCTDDCAVSSPAATEEDSDLDYDSDDSEVGYNPYSGGYDDDC